MKLKELLEQIYKDGEFNQNNFVDNTLYGEESLKPYKEQLLQTDEFKGCEELILFSRPILQQEDKVFSAQSFKLTEGQRFCGKCYLLSIYYTPEMFDPNTIHTPVKDGACMTPTLYDQKTFEPKKKIVLEFSPERSAFSTENTDEDVKKELRELLDKVLSNPQDYMIKGERGIMVRGVFERNELVKEIEPPKFLNGIETDPKYAIVYYFEKEEKEPGISSMTLKSKNIPLHLREKFIEVLGDKKLDVTAEEIDKFLEDNK